jgi:RNA polymerase sigma-70 factor (ECF subfamily)
MPTEASPDQLEEIIRRVQDGSPEHFHELYDLFSRPIYNFIWRLIGSAEDAEDLTQETFLKVYNQLWTLREPRQFKFWLYRVARNEVYQKLRRSQKTTEVPIEDPDSGSESLLVDKSPHPERQVLSGELHEVIVRALGAMPAKYRDVFVLAVFQKMSYRDITKVVGRSLLSVKTDIYRARLIAKDILRDYLQGRDK